MYPSFNEYVRPMLNQRFNHFYYTIPRSIITLLLYHRAIDYEKDYPSVDLKPFLRDMPEPEATPEPDPEALPEPEPEAGG